MFMKENENDIQNHFAKDIEKCKELKKKNNDDLKKCEELVTKCKENAKEIEKTIKELDELMLIFQMKKEHRSE